MKALKENKFLMILILIGAVIFFFIANILMSTNKKVTAVVPAGTIEASTTITENMVKTIQISADTPGNFVKNVSTVIGSKLKVTVSEGQLLYESDFMSSWINYTEIEEVPEDYIITSIQVPDSNACGGIITAGDYIDVLLVESEDENQTSNAETKPDLWPNYNGTDSNYILSNVLVLTTDSALAKTQESDISTITGTNESSNGGNFYIVALSYNDYIIFKNREKSGEIWLNICPEQNKTNPPLINQMTADKFAYLHDAQKQVMDKDGNMLVDDYYTIEENGFISDKPLENIDSQLFDDTETDIEDEDSEIEVDLDNSDEGN